MEDRKILYVRYNRNRTEAYQTVTEIVESHGERYLVKRPLDKAGVQHIRSYKDKYDMALKLYNRIVPLKGEFGDDEVLFPFISGKSMRDCLDECKNDLDRLYDMIDTFLAELLDFREERITEYLPSEKCVEIFGDNFASGRSVEYADIDIIFDNIKKKDGVWVSFDYEWMLDFPIPIDFIRWRILYRYYCSEYEYFKNTMDLYGFMKHFGYDKDIVDDFEKREIHFLSHVFADRCNYMGKYQKPVVDIDYLNRMHGNVDIYIRKLEQDAVELNRNISELNQEISNKNRKISELNQIIERSDREILRLEDENEFIKNAYNAVLESVSWKITKPVRAVVSKLRHEDGVQ